MAAQVAFERVAVGVAQPAAADDAVREPAPMEICEDCWVLPEDVLVHGDGGVQDQLLLERQVVPPSLGGRHRVGWAWPGPAGRWWRRAGEPGQRLTEGRQPITTPHEVHHVAVRRTAEAIPMGTMGRAEVDEE